MKKILKNLAVLLLLNSCASTMMTSNNIQPNEINNLGNFQTISLIRLIEKGNQSKYNDSLSILSTRIMDSIISNTNNPKVRNQFTLKDKQLQTKVENDILKIVSEIRNAKKLDQIRTTPLMDSIVKNQNQRFAMCIINAGFDRKKGNYGNQIAKGIGVGILTMGMYTPVPIKANTSMYAMIFDAQKSSVIFYNTIPFVEKSPTDKKNLNQLYNKIFDGYFYNRK